MCLLFSVRPFVPKLFQRLDIFEGNRRDEGPSLPRQKTYSFTIGSWFMRSSGKASITCNWNILLYLASIISTYHCIMTNTLRT